MERVIGAVKHCNGHLGRLRKNIGWPVGTLDCPLVAIYTTRAPTLNCQYDQLVGMLRPSHPALRLSVLNSAHCDIAAMLNTLLFCSSVFVCSVAQCYIVFLLCCIVCVCCLVCACLMGAERDLWMVSQLTDKVGKSKKQLTREYQS